MQQYKDICHHGGKDGHGNEIFAGIARKNVVMIGMEKPDGSTTIIGFVSRDFREKLEAVENDRKEVGKLIQKKLQEFRNREANMSFFDVSSSENAEEQTVLLKEGRENYKVEMNVWNPLPDEESEFMGRTPPLTAKLPVYSDIDEMVLDPGLDFRTILKNILKQNRRDFEDLENHINIDRMLIEVNNSREVNLGNKEAGELSADELYYSGKGHEDILATVPLLKPSKLNAALLVEAATFFDKTGDKEKAEECMRVRGRIVRAAYRNDIRISRDRIERDRTMIENLKGGKETKELSPHVREEIAEHYQDILETSRKVKPSAMNAGLLHDAYVFFKENRNNDKAREFMDSYKDMKAAIRDNAKTRGSQKRGPRVRGPRTE